MWILLLIIAAAAGTVFWPADLPVNSPLSRLEFARNFLAAAGQVDMKGIPAAMAMSVAALETGWGTGGVFQKTNSLFNIKVTPAWKGSKVQIKNSDGLVEFRAYGSWAESIRDWVALISGTKYYHEAYAFALAGNFKAFFSALQIAGYAGSDTQYAAKLENTHKAIEGVA
jgi:flagellum-specific peptidoglycan hydrolase FlgJ